MKFQDLKKSLLSKNPFKRSSTKHSKLYDQYSFDNDNQFYSYYIGNTILSYGSNEGSASSCINRIIETVCWKFRRKKTCFLTNFFILRQNYTKIKIV
jgi:hypothetical protein